MKHFALLDSSGTINGYTYSPQTPGNGWVEVEVDLTGVTSSLTKKRLINGQVVDTGQPTLPPHPWLVWDVQSVQWIDPRTSETEWPLVRAKRDKLLLASDWTQLPDVPLATKDAWVAYRQALRDVTTQADPFNIVWPVAPA